MNDSTNRIKYLHSLTGLSYSHVADNLKVTIKTYRKYLDGDIPVIKMVKVAAFFQVPTDFLYGIGIYEQWDLILKCRREMVSNPTLPLAYRKKLADLSEIDFIRLIFTVDGTDIDKRSSPVQIERHILTSIKNKLA